MKTETTKPSIARHPLLAPYRALLGPGLDEYLKGLAEPGHCADGRSAARAERVT